MLRRPTQTNFIAGPLVVILNNIDNLVKTCMTTPYLITKSPKSIGVALLLTFLFGPFGLLYASVWGGLIMILFPVILAALLITGALHNSLAIAALSLNLIIVFAMLYWLILIIWAIVSVNAYNNEIKEEAKKQMDLWDRLHEKDQTKNTINLNQKSPNIESTSKVTMPKKPSFQEWAKNNPGKSINDYYGEFGR